MADYKQLFKTTDNQNWLKVAVAIHITKTGLTDFVTDAAVKLRDKITNDIQQGTNLPAGTRCNKCNTCPEANCEKFRKMIKTYHRFHGPSWRNTNANDWCTNPWEVAKCFFPGDGYRDKLNAQETDFNGIVGFILNSTTFDGQTGENLSDIKGNKFSKCRQFVNLVRHSATLEVKDADRKDYITQLKNLLTSGAVLQNNTKAIDAHGQLTSLENDKLTITTDDIVKVIEDTLEETKQLISKANEANKEASNINANTRDLQTKLETLNDIYTHAVEDIEKQKQDAIKVIQAEGNTNVAKVTDQANIEYVRIQDVGNTNVAMLTDQANIECDRIQDVGNTNVAKVTDQANVECDRIQDVGNTNVAKVTDQANVECDRIQDEGNTNVAKVTDQANVECDRIQDVGNTNVAKVTDQANAEYVRIQDVGNTNVAMVTDQANVECDRIQDEGNTNVAKVTDQADIEYVRIQDVGNTNVAKVTDQANVECVRIQEAGDKALQDTELVLEAASSKFRSDIKTEAGALCLDVEQQIKKQGNTKIKALEEEKEKVVTDARDEMTEEAYGIIRATKSEVGEIKTKICEELETEKDRHVTALKEEKEKVAADTRDEMTEEAYGIIRAAKSEVGEMKTKICEELETEKNRHITDMGISLNETAHEIVKKRKHDIQEEGNTNVAKVKDQANVECDRIREAGNKTLQAIKTQEKNTTDQKNYMYEEKKNELQQALAHHYWTEHDSMPLSPLMPEEDDKLAKFYMPLKMNKVDTKSSTKSVQTKDNVDTYKSLFYNDNNSYRNIYIQGEAGIGKSTFCTKLGLIWSEKNLPDCYKKDSSINKSTVKPKLRRVFTDESVISTFDFVFSLALRNVKNECEIEKMIEKQIINELPDCTKYAGLVPTILDKERCLIVLDGLDEWSHRSDLCEKSGCVPHRKSWSNAAVLTSTRPWKINEVRLRDSEISTLIQVTGLTDSETFIENVLNCLNDKYNKTLDVKDFITYMKDKQLEHFLDTPVVAMQLLWLWHDGHELGDSKCQIYINMLDMLFGRAGEKSPSASDDIADSLKAGLPPCFVSTEFCEQHKMLLDCLGSLAFHTLYSSKREETLVFSESIVKSHVKSAATLKTALKTGILSQYKSPSRTVRRSLFSFLHKTFQEFLAAYYIATQVDESENIVKTLFQVYGQTVDVMDISELFIFVCGLNTEMSCKISDSVMKSFSDKLTDHIEELHVSGGDYNVDGMTYSLQEMILAGYKESISNGHQDPQLALHHVYYSRYISGDDEINQDILVGRNKDKIVTLSAGDWYETCTVDEVKIQQILTQSSSTLSHVSLVCVKGLTGASLDLFTNITLKSLYLINIYTHFDIKLNTSSLLYCRLDGINKEVEHSVLSALTTAPKLHTLEVRECKNMSLLCQVLPTLPMLHTLVVQEMMIPASLCQAMSTLTQLQTLTVGGLDVYDLEGCEDPSLLGQLPSTLSNLQYIQLVYIDLGDSDILLPNSVQEIELLMVILTCRSVRQLVDRLTQIPHKVTCTLDRCTLWDCRLEVRPEKDEEWDRDAIVKHIQQSHIFEIHHHDIDGDGLINLHFTKI